MVDSGRYNSLNGWLKGRYGARVYKVSLDAGLTCPNRDGTAGTGGCSYCNMAALSPATSPGKRPSEEIEEQLASGIDYIRRRHGATKFISYFQSGSNTYAPVGRLEEIYGAAISHEDVVGLAVSTRPDCIDGDVASLLSEFCGRTFLWVELGLQSSNDASLKAIGRGHDVASFVEAARLLHKMDIRTCAHVIIGLPGEGREEILDTARLLNASKVWGVKLHNLHVLRDTRFENMYNDGELKLLSLPEYAGLVADFLEVLDPGIVVHRLNSHSPRQITVAPEWSINKLAIFNEVERELERRNTKQGRKL